MDSTEIPVFVSAAETRGGGGAGPTPSWQEQIDGLLSAAEQARDRHTRVGHLARAAELYESRLQDAASAQLIWQTAFAEDFADPRAASALERLAAAMGTGDSLVNEAQVLLMAAEQPTQRAALLTWIARWQLRFLNDEEAAEDALVEALRAEPGHLGATQALRDLNRARGEIAEVTPPPETPGIHEVPSTAGARGDASDALIRRLDEQVARGQWRDAVGTLQALAAGEAGAVRSKYLATAGHILASKLQNHDGAVDLLNRALDADPYNLKAFERLYRMLAGRRVWPEAESNLLRMIARIKTRDDQRKTPTLVALWRRLGDVYRLGLGDLDAAANAYTVCSRMAPGDPRFPKLLDQLAEMRRRG